ncbi:YALIA101S05e11144g1_1 [Yarrowia lipolytica]|jgi:Ran-binding protein 3|nr:Ran-specific GTPase-activating protein 2 [Yarrowia lipolytica]SEI34809.1 YALIA101S05e11144g1_1 [Yarrowia lipolytica]
MSKRTREERESIATPQKIDIKRRKSEEDVVDAAEVETTPTKPVTGIKWIPSEEDVADAVAEAAEETKAIAAETQVVADEIKAAEKEVEELKEEVKADENDTKQESKEVGKEAGDAGSKQESNADNNTETKADETTGTKADETIETKAGETAETVTESATETKLAKAAETKTESSAPETKDTNGDSKPKHVFGSNSKFSGGFGAFKGGSLWGKPASTTTSSITTPASPAPAAASTGSSGYVFGSATKYSGGFSSVLNNLKKDDTKSDNPWAEKKKEDKTEDKKTDKDGEDKNDKDKDADDKEKEKEQELEKEKEAEHYIGVSAPLAKKESMETGEEGEESIYTCRAKLYYFDLTNTTEGWKERGVGQVHINKLKPEDVTETCSGRIVMRTDAVHRVVLNMGLVKGLEVQAGMGASLSSDKVVRISTIEDNKPVQYALKTGNPDAAKQLLAGIKGLIPV